MRFFQVSVLAPHHPGAQKTEAMDGMDVFRFRYFLPERKQMLADGRGIQNNFRASWLGKVQVPLLFTAEYMAARRILKRHEFKVVNSHWLIPSGLVMAMLKNRFGFKHIITVHAADYYLLKSIPSGEAVLRWIISRAEAVLPVSRAIQAGLKDSLPPHTRLEVIPMAADMDTFRPTQKQEREKARQELGLNDRFVVLFVGKLSEKKGVEFLIKAAKSVFQDIPDLRVLIIGEGHRRESLERMARETGLEKVVEFVGPLPHSQLHSYYSASHVLVVPSIIDRHGESEGMPVVILEAMASGTPVIGTTCCAVPEELKTAGFFEIQPANTDQLEKAIKDLKNKNETIVETSKIKNFSWHETSRKYAQIFRETMSNP
jgi:glycosyltransferase involved in cell wall biosynthesis